MIRHLPKALQFVPVLLGCLLISGPYAAIAQAPSNNRYEIGNPVLTDLWVDGQNGSDNNSGSSRVSALRTITAAWARIPQNQALQGTGYHLKIASGTYTSAMLPNYWENRIGTYHFPIIMEAVDGAGSVTFTGDMNVFGTEYLYLVGVRIAPGGDAFHCEACNHILLRNVVLDGGNRAAQEALKVNQSQYFYVEDSNIHGAGDNALDFVSVQYGHIVRNKIHDASDWCAYVKGGSAYILVEGNEIHDCGTGGFTAGQGSGFEFTTVPWLHFEAYDIKFVNNIVHDTEGAGFGVNGGYNILAAHNTFYRVGARSHTLEVVFGARSCDGDAARCEARRALGGWGPGAVNSDDNPIPNRNVFIYNNIIYNPAPFRSGYQHFAIYGPRTPPSGMNIPSPARTDSNLQIRGNIIWDGPGQSALGIEDEDQGCRPGNPSCNESQLRAENLINTLHPALTNPQAGDFRPIAQGNLFSAPTYPIPSFAGNDRETTPLAPSGNVGNAVPADRGGASRDLQAPIAGAYAAANSSIEPIVGDPVIPDDPDLSIPGDTEPPQISRLKLSKKRASRNKKISIQARVADNVSVARVWVTIDGVEVAALRYNSRKRRYEGSFRIGVAGHHSVAVLASDLADNTSQSAAGTVRIR